MIEINDTLQLTHEQGFPVELDLESHLVKPYNADDFASKTFSFRNKPGIRIYKIPPVRNFLVENKGGRWIYWGLIHVLATTHDYTKQVTSGTFKLIYLYTPKEMRKAHEFIDRNTKTQYFT